MTTHEVKGFLLQAFRLSESRWRLSLFTRELGQVTAWMRTSSSKKNPLIFEPFMPLWFVLQNKAAGLQVKQIEIDRVAPRLTEEALFGGWYINELLIYLLLEREPFPELFDTYALTLEHLREPTLSRLGLDLDPKDSWAGSSHNLSESRAIFEIILRQFEWTLLQSLGYGISLTTEAKTLKRIQAQYYYQCIPGTGLVESKMGLSGEVCLALSEGDWGKKDVLKGARLIMRCLIDHLLEGRPLKTRSLYRSIYALNQ